MSAERSIAGRVAVITGAASGIGRATAELFADELARVAVIDVGADRVAEVVAAIHDEGGTAIGLDTDITDAGAVEAALERVRSELGPVDILVNNAGVSIPATIDSDGFWDSWERTLAVNLTAQARLIRLCLPDLVRHGAGRIVNVSSTEGVGGSAGIAAYTVSKHGVLGLTRALAVELGPTGVTVNAVCPGPINTGMTALIPPEDKARFARRRTALRRYGEPIELAHAILHLVLPASSYITGHALMADGGMTIRNN